MTFLHFGFTQNGGHERIMAYAALHRAFKDAFEVGTVSPWFAKCRDDIEFLIHDQHTKFMSSHLENPLHGNACPAHVAPGPRGREGATVSFVFAGSC